MTSLRTWCVLLLALACLGAWPRSALAQVRQCTMPDGRPLYTDQKCEALGAVPATKPPAPTTGAKAAETGVRLSGGGCSRTLQDLVFELTSAIDAGDANRLSSIYHWVGISDAGAVSVMDQLDRIAHRPLLDITPVSAQPAAEAAITGAGDIARTTARRPPVGLRLEQTLPNRITPAPTVLGLRRHFGCWWVTL
jgi:hypothetical protein